jgi:hypothetical protein
MYSGTEAHAGVILFALEICIRESNLVTLRPLHLRNPLTLLLVLAAFALANRATAATFPPYSSPTPGVPFAIADFDGDNRPDLATVEIGQVTASNARYWIGFKMTAAAPQLIPVTAPLGGLEITSRDVNGDNTLDLVVTTSYLRNPVAILVNDGHGHFTLTDPAAFSSVLATPEIIWTSPNLLSSEATLALPARISQDCALTHRASPASLPSAARTPSLSPRRSGILAVSSLGRAPPLSVHHV